MTLASAPRGATSSAPTLGPGGIPALSRLSVRVGLFTTAMVLLANAANLGVVAWSLEVQLNRDLERQLASARADVQYRLDEEGHLLAAATGAIAREPSVQTLLGTEAGDRESLERAALALKGNAGAGLLVLLDRSGDTLASSPPGVVLDPASIANLRASEWSSFPVDQGLQLGVLAPVESGGHRVGALVASRLLGDELVAALARQTGAEILVASSEGARASALHSVSPEALLELHPPAGAVVRKAFPRATLLVTELPLGAHARILLAQNRTEAFRQFGPTLLEIVALGAGTLAFVGVLAFLAGKQLARPIVSLTDAARRVAAGDLSDSLERELPQPSSMSGEERQLATSFRHMLDEIRGSRAALEEYAQTLEREVSLKATALERSKAADRAKSSFLANMSHELRTPLNAIIGYSEMLAEELEGGSPSVLGDLDRIHGAGTHLLDLINSVLDLSKIEAGRMELHLESQDLALLVRDVAATVLPLFEKSGNRLVVSCRDDIGTVTTDVTKVRQILLNLLSNACKFTSAGTVEIRVGERHLEGGRDGIVLSVIDTGIGLTDEQIARLFQEFSQADSSTTRKYGGTGLGLAISQRYCQMMDGDITVTSTPGVGSTFTVVLPRVVSDRTGFDDEGEHTQIAGPGEAGLEMDAVLVVDDDPAVRDILIRSLRKDSFRVVTASSGPEALRAVHDQKFMAITLDVDMPGTDGWTVLQRLKSDPTVADIPVVMVTIEDDRDRGFALGAEEYLTKPVDRGRLRRILERFRRHDRAGVVLVVDDDEPNRGLVARTLERDGWHVREAENGRIALESVALHGLPSAILLDLMMPEMDGFEFLRRLRELPGGAETPVVVLTALELTEETRRELASRVASILEKGHFTVDELIGAVRIRLLQARAARGASTGSRAG